MKVNNFKIFSYLLIVVFLTLGLSISFQSLLAAWLAPSANPPNGNTDEPLNKGLNLQIKRGPLYVNFDNLVSPGLVALGSAGIGTVAPTEKLTVAGGHGDTKLRLYSTGDGGSQPANLSFWASEPGWTYYGTGIGYNVNGSPYYGRIDSARSSAYVRFLPGQTKFEFQNTSNTYISNVLVINDTGKVGIGTISPATTLDIRATTPAITIGKTDNTDGALYFGNSGHGVKRNYSGLNDVGLYTTSADIYLSANGTATNQFVLKNSGNVGIGTISPLAKLQVQDGAVAFTGDTGATPISGAGTRLMWIPEKAAFRAGLTYGNLWNDAFIGNSSVAMGTDVRASGNFSFALGVGSSALGNASIATGNTTRAEGDNATAMGSNTGALGDNATAMGHGTTASGFSSTAMGDFTVASGDYSTSLGGHTLAGSYASVVLGRFNAGGGTADSWVATDPIFEVGIGADDVNKANALTVLKNGNVGIGMANPGYRLDVSGDLKTSGGGAFGGYNPSATHRVTTPTFYALEAQIGNPAGGLKGAGSINASNVCIAGVCQNSWSSIGGTSGWTDDGTTIRLTTISDSVGIGIVSPSSKLQINVPAGVEGLKIISSINSSPLVVRNTGNSYDLFKVDQDGNTYVRKDLTVAGKLDLTGADVAEEFSTPENYEAGTVLVMGDSGYRSARASDQAYDSMVIGVVSDNPAVIMGKATGENKAIVAVIGIIKVKVTDSNGKVRRGDLLTSSAIRGYAMKATENKLGTIIGKALEDLEGERGEIMTLINLQ